MTFKTLEQRYKEKVNELYAGATTKFENGRPGGGTNADPLNPRKIGDESFGRISQLFGRFLPATRALQDVLRLTKFTASARGITFLTKQALLQTGNTFETTRLINPLFAIANAVPFLHMRRHLTPGDITNGLIGRTDTSDIIIRRFGQLQETTYDTAVGKSKSLMGTLGSAFRAKKNVGQIYDWGLSRPELYPLTEAFSVKSQFSNREAITLSTEYGLAPQRFFNDVTTTIPEFSPSRVLVSKVAEGSPFIRIPRPQRGQYYADNANIRKDLKQALSEVGGLGNIYSSTNSDFDDYIDVKFQMANDQPVKFRAYLSNLQQSATPQYKDYQYVGRTEKFVTYSGVQRDVSFRLTVLAEKPEELKEVWKRINYLTGLTFPYGTSRGIYQPNILKFTIGNVFRDQPAYVTSLSTNFSEVIESWDIDEGVPMGATIDMKCILIEKAQRTSTSPFYKITEDYFDRELEERALAVSKINIET